MTEQKAAADEQIAALTTETEEKAAAIAALTTETEEKAAAIAALTTETEEKAAEIAALTTALESTEATLADTTTVLNATAEELSATQSTLSSTQTTMIELLSQHALAEGYNGPITVSAIINGQGTIAYLTIDAAGETEGLGQKVMDTEYLATFLGKKLPLTLGEDIDGVAGATITSQAVVNALNLLAPDYENARPASSVINQRSVTKEVAYVQDVQGYDSVMKVVVYTTPEGVVTAVNVYAENESNGQDVMDNAFTSQFVGHSSEVTLGNEIDAVAGATTTSQAVVDAVNNIIGE